MIINYSLIIWLFLALVLVREAGKPAVAWVRKRVRALIAARKSKLGKDRSGSADT